MSSPRIQVFDTSSGHYDALKVANGKLQADIFTSSNLNVDIAGSSVTLLTDSSATTQPISAASLPLPSGAATEATLSAVDTKLAGTILTDSSATTQPISAASLPLPTGAATEATLSTLDGKVIACDTGDVVVSSMPIVQGSDGGTATDIQVDSHGCVSVKVKELENSGTYGNAWNNATITAAASSTTIDVSALSHANVFISDSDFSSTDTYSVYVSQDNTNFHHIHTFYPYDRTGGGSTREDKALLELHGMLYLYIKNDSGSHSGVYASVYGSP